MPERTEERVGPLAGTKSTVDRAAMLTAHLEPVLAGHQLELVEVVVSPTTVQVLVERAPDHPLGGRIDLDGVSAATRIVDAELEVLDPVPGAYTLEVSSPGLERRLRTPAHFIAHVGSAVQIKLLPGAVGERRIEGRLDGADGDGATVGGRTVGYAEIESARTVFVWGGQPKGGQSKGGKPHAGKAHAGKPQAGRPVRPTPGAPNAGAAIAVEMNSVVMNPVGKKEQSEVAS